MKNTKNRRTITEEITGTISEIIKQVRRLIRKGNARRIMIQNKDGKVLFQSQLTVGIAGTAALTAVAPVVSAISMFALFMNDIKIIVEKYPEEEFSEDNDEYEVEADFIEIRDEEEQDEEDKNIKRQKQPPAEGTEEASEKTVGKKGKQEDD